jgi:hypothetical protein
VSAGIYEALAKSPLVREYKQAFEAAGDATQVLQAK